MDLYLVRHAQASFGATDYDRLSPLGERQAARLGTWMARQRCCPELVATGTLRRHTQTAEGCLKSAGIEVPLLVAPGLDEFDSDEVIARHVPALSSRDALLAQLATEQNPSRAFQTLLNAAIARWSGGAHDTDYHTAWPVFRAQVLDAFDTLTRDAAREVWLFSSGGPISVIVAALLGVPPTRCFELCWPLVNTSVTRIRVGRSTRQLVSYNTWSHFDSYDDQHQLITYR
jgi:broad specificity phosphatase PhoE